MSIQLKTIVKALIFVVAGMPGLLLLFVSSVSLFGAFYDPNAHQSTPVICGLSGLLVLSLLLLLIGVGKWKQWRYLLVFIAFPVALFSQILFLPSLDGKLLPALFAGIISYLVFYLVRCSYKHVETTPANR